MALTKIFTGMEKGPEMIDANFGKLMAGAAVGVEKFGIEAFTLSNGASWYGDDHNWQRLISLELGNGYRIVQLDIGLKIADYKAAKDKAIASIPAKYAPKIDWHPMEVGSGNNHVRWNMGADGLIAVQSVMNESSVNADFWYPLSTIYITND